VDWHSQHPVSRSRGTLAHILSESFHPNHPGQSLLEEALKPQSPLQLIHAKATVSQLQANFLSIMDLHGLDAIISLGLVGRLFWLVLQNFQLYVVVFVPPTPVYRSIQAEEGRRAIWNYDCCATWGRGNPPAGHVSWHTGLP
jgi:hypothetical protein